MRFGIFEKRDEERDEKAVEERAGGVVGFPDAAFFGFCGDWD